MSMAALAGGKTFGVAPNADLVLVKTKTAIKSSPPIVDDRRYPQSMKAAAMDWFFYEVEKDITARLAQDNNAKSVISMSWGAYKMLITGSQLIRRAGIDTRGNYPPTSLHGGKLNHMRRRLLDFLSFCDEHSIPVIVAAGNDNVVPNIADHMPQNLAGRPESVAMTVVGAVDRTGRWSDEMVKDPAGHIDVFGPGVDIEAPLNGNVLATNSGTSQATAITVCCNCKLVLYSTHVSQAGLVAYYNGLNLRSTAVGGPKELLKQHAWVRTNAPRPQDQGSDARVIYNLARGDPVHDPLTCVRRRGVNGKRQETEVLCSISSTSTVMSG